MSDRSRLMRLLVMIQSAAIDAPAPISDEAMERAGFSLERREPDPFLGRRLVNEVMERDRLRKARKVAGDTDRAGGRG